MPEPRTAQATTKGVTPAGLPPTAGEPAAAEDLGSMLRAAREAAGRSLREIAEVTKLTVRTLEALERNQIERLPSGIFRRAIVRAYAKEVGLDPEATVKRFLARHPDSLPPPGAGATAIVDAPARVPQRTTVALVTGVLVVLVVLLMVAAYLLWPRVHSSRTTDGDGDPRPTAIARSTDTAPLG